MEADKSFNQANFGGGINAQAAPHLIGENEVALATNVDFSLEWGALVCRRGSVYFTTPGAQPISLILRNYNGSQGSLDSSLWYVVENGTNGFYRGTSSTAFTQISAGDSAGSNGQGVAYKAHTYLANGTVAIRDNGTNAYPWVLPQPPQIYMQVTQQTAPFYIGSGTGGFSGTWTATTSGGSFIAAAGTPILNTFTNGTLGTQTSSGIVAIATVIGSKVANFYGTVTQTIQNTDFSQPWQFTLPVQGGTFYGSSSYTINSIGEFGVDYMQIGFSNPNAVLGISIDYSIGDTSFTNYWHAQANIGDLQSGVPDSISQFLSQQGNNSYQSYLDSQLAKIDAKNPRPRSGGLGGKVAASLVQSLPNGIMTWAVPRTNYQLIGTYAFGGNSTGWESINAIRLSVQTSDQTAVIFGTPRTWGDRVHCLSDTVNGFTWFQTYAIVENGVIVAESAPSVGATPSGTSTDTRSFLGQFVSALLNIGTVTASQGITHRILYRQGGFLNDAYAVDMFPIGSASAGTLAFDYAYPDMSLITGGTMTRSLWSSWPGVNAISEPFQERIFLGSQNKLYWSTPGNPSQIEADSGVTVSNQGDPIQALLSWDRLIIVNNNSVYEIDGSVWEGANQDWTLRKSGSRRGSAASKTCIKTPYGILLFSYDGLSLYTPGFGVDQSLDWVYEKIGDAWRGTSSNAPAAQKGRILAINPSAISQSCAVYADNKIYLAVPTGTNSVGCDTIFVLDMSNKIVSGLFQLDESIQSMYYDYAGNRLVYGATTGDFIQFEVGQVDRVSHPIVWSAQTRAWSTQQDLVLENLNIEALAGTGVEKFYAIVDNTSTSTLGTATSTDKKWYTTPLLGTIGNNVQFKFVGTQSGAGAQSAIYQINWDSQIQPTRNPYYKSEPTDAGIKGEKIWDVNLVEIEAYGTSGIRAVTFVDNVAVSTYTISSPMSVSHQPFPFPYNTSATGTLAGNGPVLIPITLPAETYGNIAYTTFVSLGNDTTFKLWNNYYNVRPEPPRVTSYVTDRITLPTDNYVKTWLSELNPLSGIVTGTLFIDGVATATSQFSGSHRQVFEVGLPNVTTGKEFHILYTSSTPFKYWDRKQSNLELEPKPFYKTTWLVTYKKLGGVTQVDMARFFALDIEAPLGVLLTNTWIIDGTIFSTNTFTLSNFNAGENDSLGRVYNDQIPFPPGGRGYLFQQQISSASAFRVWRSNMDIDRVGIKGLSRVTINGTPG